MIGASIEILQTLREERVRVAGVILAMHPDDPHEAVRRMEEARDAAKECATRCDWRKERAQRVRFLGIAEVADDLLPAVRQVADLDASTSRAERD